MNQTIRSLSHDGRESGLACPGQPASSFPIPCGTAYPSPERAQVEVQLSSLESRRSRAATIKGPGQSNHPSAIPTTSLDSVPFSSVYHAQAADPRLPKMENPPSEGTRSRRGIACLLLILLYGLSGCSKSIEDQQRDLIVGIMTDGRWMVQVFQEQNTDLSQEFTGYEFQFIANGTVQAIKGSSVTEGTWSASASSYSITSGFPTGDATLKRLNDTWRITNNTLRFVEARPMDNLRTAYLKLVKK
jgi:hypothetical protein